MSKRKVVIRRFDEEHYGVGIAIGTSFDLLFALHWEALNEQVPALVAEIERLQKALQTIADYERPRQATSAWPVITTLQDTARQALGKGNGN